MSLSAAEISAISAALLVGEPTPPVVSGALLPLLGTVVSLVTVGVVVTGVLGAVVTSSVEVTVVLLLQLLAVKSSVIVVVELIPAVVCGTLRLGN